MARSRRDALERMLNLQPGVEEHLQKIYEQPGHNAQNHWRHEVRVWLGVMNSMVQHVGQKTAAEWRPILESYAQRLEAAP